MTDSPPPPSPVQPWIVRISDTFAPQVDEILKQLGAEETKRLGDDYFLIKTPNTAAIRSSPVAAFLRWNLPVHHSWPCNPQRMESFIEKAAQTMWKKFGDAKPQNILIGQLNHSSADPYYKRMCSNLRGRTLQLFPPLAAPVVEEQIPDRPTLFALLGKEGLYCGVHSPREANGFYAGGSRYISLTMPSTISRAGGKIAEALHYLRLYRPPLPEHSHWLELGAAPGGMTSELLTRGYRVTALDRAPLDRRLEKYEGLEFIAADVTEFTPPKSARYDALLCDMNGPPHEAMEAVLRLSSHLAPRGLVVFTLKFSRTETTRDPLQLLRNITTQAHSQGLTLLARTHLTYNGHEFTLFFERGDSKGK